jgi:hypothetical protein
VYEIRRASTSNKVIDIPNSTSTPGVQMHLWDDHDGPNQRWVPKIDRLASAKTWLRTPNGDGEPHNLNGYKLVNPANGLCLDGFGGSTAPGTRVIQYTCGPDGTLNQTWFPIEANGAEFLVSGSSFANIDAIADVMYLRIVNSDIRVESKRFPLPIRDHGQAVAIAASGSSNGSLLTLEPASTYNRPQQWVTTVVSGTSTVDPDGETCLSCLTGN